MPESTAYKWLTASAVKAEEKLQANQRQISKKSTSRLPDDLPIRQAVFVEEYLTDFNGTNAAKKAGYSEERAASTACNLRNKPQIKKAIGQRIIERMDGNIVSSKEALAELVNLAMANFADIAEWNGGAVSLKDSATLHAFFLAFRFAFPCLLMFAKTSAFLSAPFLWLLACFSGC